MTNRFEDHTGLTDRRRRGRAPLGLAITARERSRTAMQARLVDLNSFGAQIEGLVLTGHEPGAWLWLRLPGLESLAGRLVWSNRTRIGIEFDTPLHPAVASRFAPAPDEYASPLPAEQQLADRPRSRRDQILAGICDLHNSPLARRKRPLGQDLAGRVVRMIRRRADHRGEARYGDVSGGGVAVAIEGVPARILDMSSSGIRVEARLEGKDIGETVSVSFAGFHDMTGRLVWMKANESGISLPAQSIELFEQA